MKRIFAGALALVFCLLAVLTPASAQTAISGRMTQGTILQNGAVALGNGNTMDVRAFSTAVFYVTGTLTSMTITFEISPDLGTTWYSLSTIKSGTTTTATTTTATGGFTASVAGYTHIRARVSTYSSGTVTIKANAYSLPFALVNTTLAGLTGAAASGAALSGNPVLTAGSDGTNAVNYKVDSSGRLFVVGGAASGAAVAGNPLLVGYSDGTNAETAWTASAANQAAANAGLHALTVAPPGQWIANHVPSTATLATVTKAAGSAGVRHVCTGIYASVSCDSTAQTPIKIYLRDGATTAGTILWAGTVAAPANGSGIIEISGLNILGTAATAMCGEFSGAGVTGSQCVVTITGYDTI
jgi:hypothetical protein